MKRVAIFTEGQSEQIFVRNFLMKLIDNAKISFECLKLLAGTVRPVRYNFTSPSATIHFMIIDVANDAGVIDAIKNREQGLLSAGYQRVVGLRDMYCAVYDKRSAGKIDQTVSRQIEEAILGEINQMSQPERISVFFEVMEFEAWILGMYNLLGKIEPRLSVENIKNTMGIDLHDIDPQTEFYRPYQILKEILGMAEIEYKKRFGDTEKLTALMDAEDFEDAIKRNRSASFKKFYTEMQECCADS
jgi:hypothetical protein